METSRKKVIFQNVGPAVLSNACVFLFSVVDGIFVGNGAGSQALGAVNLALSLNLQSFCRNDGSPGLVAVTNVISSGLNIFLDWLFVFPMQMGVMGAAVATGISQTVGLLVVSTHYIWKKGNLSIKRYKLQGKLFQKIVFRGLPEAIAQFSTPVTTLCMNRTLMAAFGDIGINAFAIISYLSSFTMAVFFGASEGMQPLFGQAYGAKQDEELKYYYRAGQLISVVGSALCVAIYVIFPHFLCKLFGADAETLEFTVLHMWEYCWGFIVGSINTMISAYFYSTKRSGQAIALNIVRSLVMNALVITVFPMIFGSGIVWHTFGIYEVLVLIIATALKKGSERNGIVYK